MPSVSPRPTARALARATGPLAGIASILAAAGPLAGCASTQQEAARLRLNADRIRVSQTDTRVTVASSTIAVASLALVAAQRRTAFVVTVRSSADHAVSDLPISVGYRAARRRIVYLNAGTNGGYFAAHLPLIAAHRSVTWVYTALRRLPAGAHPFALVGAKPSVPVGPIGRPPAIHAEIGGAAHGDQLQVAVRNLSGIPQYQLPVYAFLQHGGRTLAAGAATVRELPAGSSRSLRLRLLGRVEAPGVRLEALPTIFH